MMILNFLYDALLTKAENKKSDYTLFTTASNCLTNLSRYNPLTLKSMKNLIGLIEMAYLVWLESDESYPIMTYIARYG